jgi:RNA polymerase sigma-70 factor (ECF subfamily)
LKSPSSLPLESHTAPEWSEREREEFVQVARDSAATLFRLALRFLGHVQDAEDAVQEALVRSISSARPDQFSNSASIRSWLYRVTTNTAMDTLRKRRQTLARGGVPVPSTYGVARLEAYMALRELAAWLDELPDDQRAAFVLKDLEGLSTAEVAGILRCTDGAVEQRLLRARAVLRVKVES